MGRQLRSRALGSIYPRRYGRGACSVCSETFVLKAVSIGVTDNDLNSPDRLRFLGGLLVFAVLPKTG